jgi:teichuronic acid biosynthesis glycosyltransferase TuaC
LRHAGRLAIGANADEFGIAMNVLLITNEFPNPYEPGKAVFNLAMARTLARQHELRVVSPISWTDEWSARRGGASRLNTRRCEMVDGIEVHYPRYYYPPRMLRSQYGWFFWNSIRATVRELRKLHRADVVLGYWAHPDGEAAVRAAREIGVPSVVIAAGSDVLVVTEDPWRRRRVARALQRADAVVTVSEHLKEQIIKLGIDASKVHVWRRGVDSCFTPGNRAESRALLGIPPGPPMLLLVGRMVPVKGLDVLMEACQKVCQRGLAIRAYLLGDGPLRRVLEADRDARGLQGVVHFVGSCKHDCLPAWYRAADLTLLTSWSEGMPNVLCESLACGTPFISTDVGGVAELAAGHPDWLVEPGNADALATAIERSLTCGLSRQTQPQTIRWPESADALIRIFERLMDEPKNPALVSEAISYGTIASR